MIIKKDDKESLVLDRIYESMYQTAELTITKFDNKGEIRKIENIMLNRYELKCLIAACEECL